MPIRNHSLLLERLRRIHDNIRDHVLASCRGAEQDALAEVVGEEASDTVYAIDRMSHDRLLAEFATLAEEWPLVLIGEGVGENGGIALPEGKTTPESAEIRVIIDPIDGTRELMYQKRSAWILTGVAPNKGTLTCLSDVELAVQTEIPTLKQALCDSLWGSENAFGASRVDLRNGKETQLALRPSRARTIEHGFGNISRFFPGCRAELARIDDGIIERVLGPVVGGKAQCFEDQYISTGGQLYELMVGHDRWCADLRPLTKPLLQQRGVSLGISCHPYDICTELIARKAGVIVTDPAGQQLRVPLDVTTPVAWVAYANEHIRAQVEPALQAELREMGLL